MADVGTPVDFDDLLHALSDIQRRKLLVALLAHNPQNDRPFSIAEPDGEDETFDRLVMMQHVHLPKLAEYGLIEWDKESHEVSKGPNFDEIRPLLEMLDDHEDELPDGWL